MNIRSYGCRKCDLISVPPKGGYEGKSQKEKCPFCGDYKHWWDEDVGNNVIPTNVRR